jgi:hypothetical protein
MNVFTGIIGDDLLGSFRIQGRLTGASYLYLLQDKLPLLLENIDLRTLQQMWFLRDGAPPHFSADAQAFLNTNFLEWWIGCGGPQTWSPRSPDLNPTDFFPWGSCKKYTLPRPRSQTKEELWRGFKTVSGIRVAPGVFEGVHQSLI